MFLCILNLSMWDAFANNLNSEAQEVTGCCG